MKHSHIKHTEFKNKQTVKQILYANRYLIVITTLIIVAVVVALVRAI